LLYVLGAVRPLTAGEVVERHRPAIVESAPLVRQADAVDEGAREAVHVPRPLEHRLGGHRVRDIVGYGEPSHADTHRMDVMAVTLAR